jgi:hypothetical protein
MTRTSELGWIHIFRCEFLLGTLLSTMICDVLVPVGYTFSFLVIILCNFGVIRFPGYVLKMTLLVFSLVVCTCIYIHIYIGARLLELRRLALQRKLRRAGRKVVRKERTKGLSNLSNDLWALLRP